MKHTICLMTNWYPTPQNPYRGVFFKEQAFAVAERLDFVVVHYTERFGFGPWNRIKCNRIGGEKNTVEYEAAVKVPFLLAVWDEIYSLYRKLRGKNLIDGVGKYVCPARKRLTERAVGELFRHHIHERIDALYCVDGQMEAFHTRCAAQAAGVPYIVSEHAPVPWPGTVISDLNREAFSSADLFLAISQDKIRQCMLQNIRLPKTVYIGNLIDERRLTVPAARHSGNRTLLTVAAHSFYKNYDMFIRVMNRLAELTQAPFTVRIVGYAANKGYAKDVEAFEARIRASAFADRAELIPEVPHDEIVSVYHQADALVMTSIQEGQPVSAMEAACCGLPIFSTRCGGVEDYVDDALGRIYAVNDVEGMAQDLKAFVEGKLHFDPSVIRRKVVSRFGTEAFTRAFCDAFEGVIRNG